jgi:hypothetical protein
MERREVRPARARLGLGDGGAQAAGSLQVRPREELHSPERVGLARQEIGRQDATRAPAHRAPGQRHRDRLGAVRSYSAPSYEGTGELERFRAAVKAAYFGKQRGDSSAPCAFLIDLLDELAKLDAYTIWHAMTPLDIQGAIAFFCKHQPVLLPRLRIPAPLPQPLTQAGMRKSPNAGYDR